MGGGGGGERRNARALLNLLCYDACAGVAFLPYALYVLLAAPLGRAFGAAAAALALTAGPLIAIDRVFYGR